MKIFYFYWNERSPTGNIHSLPYTINQLMICTKIHFFYLLPETCLLVCGLQTNKIKCWSRCLHRFARFTHSRVCAFIVQSFSSFLKYSWKFTNWTRADRWRLYSFSCLIYFLCQYVPAKPSRDKFLCSLQLGGSKFSYSFILILVQVNL